ncbi:DUF305 domain-containing protein [Microbacterium sediminis]|uniref:DUF305 domain-containing protein n=1 Tax=Microbacterium sediminis TaxID=904291 RepID=A0A1B9N7V6_9MICO|nr:DUF305 domain-containing protein [Microbacterium sediminis]OCG72692.1 hypothetical protein A7J15_10675 [Microbacterium sediminis]
MSGEDVAEREGARPRRSWPLIVFVLVLVAGGAFAAGRFSAFDTVAAPNRADIGFARDMQVHHAQAVEMAMIEYRATQDDELRVVAYDIATGQQAQSGEMYAWLVEWGLPQRGSEPLMAWMQGTEHDHGGAVTSDATEDELREAMGMATDEELAQLQELAGTTAGDCLFTDRMIEHHTGALEMVAAERDLGSIPRVLQTAEAMADTQQREIEVLQSAQARLGCG